MSDHAYRIDPNRFQRDSAAAPAGTWSANRKEYRPDSTLAERKVNEANAANAAYEANEANEARDTIGPGCFRALDVL